MFNVGDNIVYPMHGAGRIAAIEEKDIQGEKRKYYIMQMPGEVKLMIPTAKAEDLGVRNVINSDGAKRVLQILSQDETEMSDNWNKRYKDNLEKMRTGDIYEIADIVRNLCFKQKEKGTLSTGEKKMLNDAKLILVSELSLAEKSSLDEIEKLVDNKIEMSYKEYRVPDEANIDLQKSAINKFIPYDG